MSINVTHWEDCTKIASCWLALLALIVRAVWVGQDPFSHYSIEGPSSQSKYYCLRNNIF